MEHIQIQESLPVKKKQKNSSFSNQSNNDIIISSKKSSNHKKLKGKKKLQDISGQISLGLRYEDFDQEVELFYPQLCRKENNISMENVSLLDQSHFKFLVKQNSDIFNHYSQYKQNDFKNISWKDIELVYFYCNYNYSCPICLESKLCCPVITKCGHAFCFPCITSLYNYHTQISINKKVPNCPLCNKKIESLSDDDKINIDKNDDLKLCEQILSINYNTNMKIKFNLIIREKKSPSLYNLIYDPLLENWKNNFKNKMRKIPDEQYKEFNFSRVFSANRIFFTNKLNAYKNDLNLLKKEYDSTSDELRKGSINECINQIDSLISQHKSENNSESVSQNSEISSNDNSDEGDIDYKKYFLFYQEEKGDIYYLHPFIMEILLDEYEDYNSLPVEIEGNILDIEINQVTQKLKSEYKYLNHLRIGSIIYFVEIDINDLISSSTKMKYNEKLYERKRLRNILKNQEKNYEDFVNKKNNLLFEEEKNNSIEDSKKSLESISGPIFFATDEELGKIKDNKKDGNMKKDENIKSKESKLKLLLNGNEKEEKKELKEERNEEKNKEEEKEVKKNKKGGNKNKKNKGGKKGKKKNKYVVNPIASIFLVCFLIFFIKLDIYQKIVYNLPNIFK